MAVKEGDWVKRGDFLAQLDATRYSADVDRAQQVLESAEASLSLAELEKNQQFELFQEKVSQRAHLPGCSGELST